ncbi:MAG: hypothetical protein BGP24_23715 [Lysobacterales bacterium 69-70]|nr:OmpA family protein [Xanthomonadaceae bacterium]ODU34388.1 MAG: hypothetical protein ABS97_09895 [Xanthomonadaceae bacterium SCN 69-320]ODV22497.1 MAG: hypothetical protein ABT27_02055 [Xanthomonadaceae bacterium SCN 69-25]OJY96293.1 MAG: hypothetical protein BGP24_23715 [Xanthomonadales bacterium 69-70]
MRLLRGVLFASLLLPGAAAFADCTPLQSPKGFVAAGAAEIKAFDKVEMRSGELGTGGYIMAEGKVCRQTYRVADGQASPDEAQVDADYRRQLDAVGAEIAFAANGQITARLAGDAERWMVIYSQPGEVSVVVVERRAPSYVLTAPSGHDYRLIGHMPDYVAGPPEINANGRIDFHVEDPAGDSDVPVSGNAIHLTYRLADGKTSASDVEVASNYRRRLRELGAQLLSLRDDARTVARFDENGRAIWLSVYSQPGEISLYVVEEQPVQMPPPAPTQLQQRLAADGHVAVYINFDFDKATLKPDAAPVLAEIVALLLADPALKLTVEGHTDAVGAHEYNRRLSAQRAEAVVKALVGKGVAAARLQSAGLGATRPLAGNDTAEGRARNRRVELVRN